MWSQWHQRLCNDGWTAETDRFWEATPCFYDLGMVRTVLLPRVTLEAAGTFYWKSGAHDLPDYLEPVTVEIRHYKLHHSMNALLWHDHGDRPLWPT